MPSFDKNRLEVIFYMPVMKVFLSFFLLCCCQLAAITTVAQVKYSFSKDTIEIKGGETFSNLLRVTNPYREKMILVQRGAKFPKGMISLPDTLIIEPESNRAFPLKYLADRQTVKSNLQNFELNLSALKQGVDVQQSAHFITQLADAGGLILGTEDNEIYLSQLTNQVQVMVRCANNGFVPLTFKLVLSGIPDGLEFTGQTMNLTLQPGAQQQLPFMARNKTGMRSASDFTVTIRALDNHNNQLAVKIIRVVSVTSAKRMGLNNDHSSSSLPNTIALRYVSNSVNSSFYQLQGNGLMKTAKGSTLEYNVNADQYQQRDFSGLNVYNTFVDYQAKDWGLRLGSVYENIDYSLSGTGVKASVKFKENSALSVYGIQNNYQLITQFRNTVPGAKIFALDYNVVDTKTGGQRITFLHGHDPFRATDANQLSFKAGFKVAQKQILAFEGGYSLENQYSTPGSAKQGGSAGISYITEGDQYQFTGSGYYSTPYFTGLRRGLLQADLRLVRNLTKTSNLSSRISIQSSNPRYQDLYNNIFNSGLNKNAISIYELGYNAKAGDFYMGLTPYYMSQHLVSTAFVTIFPDAIDWRSSSMRLAGNLSYSGANKNISLNADYGYTYMNTSDLPPAPFHSLRINANYNMPVLGFNGYVQLNPYYLTDALSTTSTNHYRLYSFGPNVHFSGLKNNLNVQLSGMYNYYGFTRTDSYTATGSLRYLLKGHWALTADVQFIKTKQNILVEPSLMTVPPLSNDVSYNNRQLRFGIEKQFGRNGEGAQNKLALAYFEDHNSNGVRDKGEPAVAGVLVKINGMAALTNSKGEVEFTGMKKEAYSVSITNTKGWSLPEPTSVFLDKNKKVEVPLVKTQALNGCLKLILSKYLEGKPALAGIRINALDPNGRIYQTLTDDQGTFCFYLPRNNYTVYIETEGMPFSIENSKEEVSLQEGPAAMLTFIYKDERRKVGVTHF